MKALKTVLLVIILMIVVMAWAQNGGPQQIWSQTFNLFNWGYQNSYNAVPIGDKIFFTTDSNYEDKLVQIDKDTRQICWVKNLSYNPDTNMLP